MVETINIFENEYNLLTSILEEHSTPMSSVLIVGPEGSGKKTLLKRAINSLDSIEFNPELQSFSKGDILGKSKKNIICVNVKFTDAMTKKFTTGKTLLMRLVALSLREKLRERLLSGNSGEVTCLLVLDHSEIFFSHTSSESVFSHNSEKGGISLTGIADNTTRNYNGCKMDVLFGGWIAELFDAIRGHGSDWLIGSDKIALGGRNCFSVEENHQESTNSLVISRIVWVFIASCSFWKTEISQFAQRYLFDFIIQLHTPNEAERMLLFSGMIPFDNSKKEEESKVLTFELIRGLVSKSGGFSLRSVIWLAKYTKELLTQEKDCSLINKIMSQVNNFDMEFLTKEAAWGMEIADMILSQFRYKAPLGLLQPLWQSIGYVDIPRTRWEEIVGLEKVKKTLEKLVIAPTRYRSIYRRHLTYPSVGVLLYGPPGTGKTMLARAMATELHASFIYLDLPRLMHSEVGESEHVLNIFFQTARSRSPCIMFLDEIQAAFGKTNAMSSHDTRFLTTVLNQLDTSLHDEKHVVLFVGATNVHHQLNKQLLRPGRMDIHINIPLPDISARRGIFEVFVLEKWVWLLDWMNATDSLHRKSLVEDMISFGVTESQGLSGAEISNVLQICSIQLMPYILPSVVDIASSNGMIRTHDRPIGEVDLRDIMEKSFRLSKVLSTSDS